MEDTVMSNQYNSQEQGKNLLLSSFTPRSIIPNLCPFLWKYWFRNNPCTWIAVRNIYLVLSEKEIVSINFRPKNFYFTNNSTFQLSNFYSFTFLCALNKTEIYVPLLLTTWRKTVSACGTPLPHVVSHRPGSASLLTLFLMNRHWLYMVRTWVWYSCILKYFEG